MAARRILVVDDDALVARSCGRSLRRVGYEVETAGSARVAIVLFEKFRPDVVVCDINMPDLNGRELLVIFREARRAAILIATTGSIPGPDDRFPVLEKPWSIADFERMLAAASNG